MALNCYYLTLLSILILIFKCTPQTYNDLGGLRYIVLDEKSNNAAFYSSLFKNGKIDEDKLTSRLSRRKRSPKSSPFIYPSNGSKSGLATEYELHGDNHTVAFLYWSGSKSQVIFIFTSNYQNIQRNPGGSVHLASAYLWRSTDYGTSFQREDNKKFNKGSKNINGIHFCKGNNKRVIVYDEEGKWVYVSDDEGNSYAPYQVKFSPQDILCTSGSRDDLLVAYDKTTSKLYYSRDSGKSWHFVCADVVQYFWAPDVLGVNSTLFIETKQEGRKYSSVLKHATLPCDASQVKLFDPQLGGFVRKSFEVQGKYMFVKKMYPDMILYVSYNGGAFKKAQFPLQLNVKEYKVVDASEDEVLVCIGQQLYYSLYISDKTGTKYSMSLHSVLASSSYRWGQKVKLADIHKVKSLRGVYLANIIRPDHVIRTLITFDKGGSWHPLRVPHNSKCQQPKCHLNLHMVHSQKYYQISSVLSSESALGLIMAQGDVGTTLTENPDVFFSSDGGLNWKKVLVGAYDFVFGDHGGLVVAVALRNYTKNVWYSCTEGKSWNIVKMEKNVKAYGLVTEPGETTWISNIFGQHLTKNFEWLSVKLNLSSVFEKKCTDQDYTVWTPNDERMKGKCLLGEHMVYERRKADICCYNGKEYDREINQTSCNCTMEDFMCDFGFDKDDIADTCVPISEDLIVPKACPEFKTYMRSSGYRKVPGDRCAGGIERSFDPVETLCPVKAPSGLSIVLKRTTLEAHTPIIFKLKQEEGSTGSTWYLWDFGDGTSPINVTGIKNAQKQNHTFTSHGGFNVTVTAGNSLGQTSTKTVVQIIDAVLRVVIAPPHAVLVNRFVLFNLSLYSQHTKLEPNMTEHGYVHFVWTFNPHERPLLTWEEGVEYNFTKAGEHTVKVEAINAISRQFGSVKIRVHGKLRTLRLSFDDELDKENKETVEWREEFGKLVLSELARIISIPRSRFEVYVMPGKPTQVDVSIIPREPNNNNSLTMDQIVKKFQQKVKQHLVEITLPGGSSTKATYAELLIDSDKRPKVLVNKKNHGMLLAILISAAVLIVLLLLAGAIFYGYRRYSLLSRRYSRLANGSDGFVPLHPGGQESVGYNADGSAVRYAVPEADNMNDSEDELLLDDVGEPGRLSLVLNEDAQQDNQSPNTA